MDFSISLGLFIVLLFIWVRWRRKQINIFKELGIPGPKPHFLFGNLLEINRKGLFECQKEWIETYGMTLGYYQGMEPTLLVADPEMLKKIFIKDFHKFCDRPETIPLRVHSFLDHITPASQIMDTVLTNLKGERWKEVRRILSPTFSANKLKMMIPAVDNVVSVAMEILKEKCGSNETINIHQILQRITLDVICAQSFGMDIDSIRNPKHPLLRSAQTIFDLPFGSKILFFGKCFPEFGILAMSINFLRMFIINKGYIPPLKITEFLGKIIKERRKDPNARKPDLLQLLIDASSNDEVDGAIDKTVINGEGNLKHVNTKTKLTDLEIKSNALIVFLAGYETTSSALGFAFHFLMKYPEIQRKIQTEIDQVFKKEGNLNYYNVNNFQVMERFLLEVMRVYPPAPHFVYRTAVEDVKYEDIQIPKGMQIQVAVDYIHKNDLFFINPQDFNPDRFLPENKTKNNTVAYWTFGIGPRSCIGTRLVNITTKIVLSKILQEFTITFPDKEQKLNCQLKSSTLVPQNVNVKLNLRTDR